MGKPADRNDRNDRGRGMERTGRRQDRRDDRRDDYRRNAGSRNRRSKSRTRSRSPRRRYSRSPDRHSSGNLSSSAQLNDVQMQQMYEHVKRWSDAKIAKEKKEEAARKAEEERNYKIFLALASAIFVFATVLQVAS